MLVRLDAEEPRAFYLSKTYNTTGAYREETQAAMSNDGSRAVWACNRNRHPGSEPPPSPGSSMIASPRETSLPEPGETTRTKRA